MLKNIPHKELVERLKTVKEVLAENESAVTPDLLEAIDMVIEMMKPADKLMKDIDDIVDLAEAKEWVGFANVSKLLLVSS